MEILERKTILAAGILTASLAAFGCDTDAAKNDQETVEAEEIAAAEGVAEPGAEPPPYEKVAMELLYSPDEDLFDELDTDSNELVDRDEFEDVEDRVQIFARFDVNEDLKIGEEEFVATMFEMWDVDDSRTVDPEEYITGAMRWFPGDTEELENFADVDADDDGVLDKAEFVGNMDDIALFDQWDLEDDAEISSDELMKVLREVWDVDDDLKIAREEWGGPSVEKGAVVAGVAEYDIDVVDADETDAAVLGEDSPEPTRALPGTILTGEARVGKVVSDRGFWVHSRDRKLFAVVREDVPKREMIDLDEGDRIKMTGIVLDSDDLELVAGTLEQDARERIADEPVFLSVYHGQVEIVDEAK